MYLSIYLSIYKHIYIISQQNDQWLGFRKKSRRISDFEISITRIPSFASWALAAGVDSSPPPAAWLNIGSTSGDYPKSVSRTAIMPLVVTPVLNLHFSVAVIQLPFLLLKLSILVKK